MLDFTKFGILLGIRWFTKKKTTFYQSWELGIFSCESVQPSIPIVQEVLFPQILKWKNQFQAFCKSHWGAASEE